MKTKTVYRSIRSNTGDRVTASRKSVAGPTTGFGAMLTKILFAEASLKQVSLKRAMRW